ncbi:hypothetical protein [Pontibacter amylolyticus]|uniref:Lipoprotein n=1 Tax=Pontibacter amylolyticus TaxID=1424080 RepID=A0ABQ1WB43_9BACT|nr:hypothetical protein [Pontibacter amylolyticus]GGG22626.1 hypothetical protein GCM10011323_28210 [Pontibacter amylolyticus]
MKKVFYSIAIVSAMMFASCSEDRGKTYETADANNDENVNQSHIRGSETAMGNTSDMSNSGDMAANSDVAWRSNATRIAGQMATDMRLDTATQNRVEQVLYERERRLSELQFNYNETNRMGGQVAEDVDNMATTEKKRYDKDGGTMTDTRGNMNTNTQNNTTTASNLDTQREQIMEETDRELQSILSKEQYRQYQEKRANYWGMSNDGTNQLDNSGTNQNQMNNNSQMNNSGTNQNQPGTTTGSGNNMNRNQ